MARTRTLTNLIADVRAVADLENDLHVTDTQITEFLNQGITELYDMLVEARGHEYYLSTTTFTTVSGTETYVIPTDMMELHKVDINVAARNWDLTPYSLHERNDYNQIQGTAPWPVVYRIMGQNISLLPIARGGYVITVFYVPHAVRLSAGSDAFDGINGWEMYPVWYAAAICLAKEESDPSYAMNQMATLRKRIENLATKRNTYGAERVRDVYGSVAVRRPWQRLPPP